jgi:serine/threonine protein phosphatase PrpC
MEIEENASDGVWDVVSDEFILETAHNEKLTKNDPQIFSEYLLNTSLQKGSRDNISCIVIKLFN